MEPSNTKLYTKFIAFRRRFDTVAHPILEAIVPTTDGLRSLCDSLCMDTESVQTLKPGEQGDASARLLPDLPSACFGGRILAATTDGRAGCLRALGHFW